MDKQKKTTNINFNDINSIKIIKDSKKFLYNLLLIALPSNIIDIILNYSLESCNYDKCRTLYSFNGVNCKKCELKYCSKQCYNYTKCKICNNLSCENCFVECRKYGASCCFNCMYKEWELNEIIYICVACDWYGSYDDMELTLYNPDYDEWESSD